jgi:hypothetical protein
MGGETGDAFMRFYLFSWLNALRFFLQRMPAEGSQRK